MPLEKTYQGIYPEKWRKIKEAAATYGIRLETAQGKGQTFGVTLSWEWRYTVSSGKVPTLTIVILDAGILQDDVALKFVDDIISQAIAT